MKTLTNENFNDFINNAEKPVLVDFWAPWCGLCTIEREIITGYENQKDLEILFAELNVDSEREIVSQLGIYSIPGIYLFNKGEILWKSEGDIKSEFLIKDEIQKFIP